MTCRFSKESIISPFTFAFFQDSGWYDVQWYYVQNSTFGKNRGCDFLNMTCLDSGNPRFPEFCGKDAPGCGLLKLYKSDSCGITTYTSIPTEFQYFNDSTIGGEDRYMDYCPVASSGRQTYCSSVQPSGSNIYGETYGEHSRCFVSTLVLDNEISTEHSGCYNVTCDSSTYSISVSTSEEILTKECLGIITFEGFAGELVCPPRDEICQEVAPCNNLCNGQGVCENGQCNCNDYRGGDDCSIECSPLCKGCYGAEIDNCTECVVNASLDENDSCVCNENYNYDGNLCCLKNCEECSSTDGNVCLYCINGLEFADGVCQCPGDNLFKDDFECISKCPEGCTNCDQNDRTVCTKCENDMCLLAGKCFYSGEYDINQEGNRICIAKEFAERLVFTLILFLFN